MSHPRIPISLPPSDIVRYASELLEPGVPRTILDAGMGEGRNSIYLARLGNFVTGISQELLDVEIATKQAARLGIADRCHFIEGDITQSMPGSYDVVLCNEVVHTMSSPARQSVLRMARNHTNQGGLNVVSGYLCITDTINDRYFSPGELRLTYSRVGWQELYYDEEVLPSQRICGKEIVFSRAKIIAQRPWN